VSGCSKQSARRQAIEQFKEGKVRVLCNCEVLTTGFDAPQLGYEAFREVWCRQDGCDVREG
jgi:superfamily II DNA or RNA helicase